MWVKVARPIGLRQPARPKRPEANPGVRITRPPMTMTICDFQYPVSLLLVLPFRLTHTDGGALDSTSFDLTSMVGKLPRTSLALFMSIGARLCEGAVSYHSKRAFCTRRSGFPREEHDWRVDGPDDMNVLDVLGVLFCFLEMTEEVKVLFVLDVLF